MLPACLAGMRRALKPSQGAPDPLAPAGAQGSRATRSRDASADRAISAGTAPSQREYRGLPELDYPWHDRTVTITTCGRICIRRQKVNVSQVFAGQSVGVKEVANRIWLVSFMHYDLGFFDDETCRLEPVANPFEVRNVLPMSRE